MPRPFGSLAVSKATYFASPCGSTCLINSPSEKPSQGITIDQPPTQRKREILFSGGERRGGSSTSKTFGLLTRPSTETVQGRVTRLCARRAGLYLSVPNS